MMIRPKNVNIPNFKYDGFQTFIWIWWSIWIDGFDKRLSQEQHNIHFPSLAELLTSCARRTLQTRACTRLHAATRGTAGGGLACTFRNMRGVLNYQLSSIFRMVHTRYKLCVHVTPLFDCFLSYNIQLRTCPAYSRVMHHCRKVAASPAPASTDTNTSTMHHL